MLTNAERRARYRARHPKRIREQSRCYYVTHRDKLLTARRQERRVNPEKSRAYVRHYRNGHIVEDIQRKRLYRQQLRDGYIYQLMRVPRDTALPKSLIEAKRRTLNVIRLIRTGRT